MQGATLQQEAKARVDSGGNPQHSLTRHTNSGSSAGIAAYKFGLGQHRTITDIYQMCQLTADKVGPDNCERSFMLGSHGCLSI